MIEPNYGMLIAVWSTALALYLLVGYLLKYTAKETGSEVALRWSIQVKAWFLRGIIIVCLIMTFFTGWRIAPVRDLYVVPLDQAKEVVGQIIEQGKNSKEVATQRLTDKAAQMQEDSQDSLEKFRNRVLNKNKNKDKKNENDDS